jgi:hypothetical protein
MIFAATLGRSLCQPVADHGTTMRFERNVGDSLELTMARDLQRHFSAVLTEPLPPDLQRFMALLAAKSMSRLASTKA